MGPERTRYIRHSVVTDSDSLIRFQIAVSLMVMLLFLIAPGMRSFAAETHMLQGEVFHNEGTDEFERLGVTFTAKTAPRELFVETVRPGSAAFYKGFAHGDQILNI